MYIQSNIKLTVNEGLVNESQKFIKLVITRVIYNLELKDTEVQFYYTDVDNNPIGDLKSLRFSNQVSDAIYTQIKPLLPQGVTDYTYQMHKFYTAAKFQMLETFLVKNPNLTINNLELIDN